tara:strand:+ start:726 stop:983 length:258 start_codon:yes stop_codon:yes gene_type:complete
LGGGDLLLIFLKDVCFLFSKGFSFITLLEYNTILCSDLSIYLFKSRARSSLDIFADIQKFEIKDLSTASTTLGESMMFILIKNMN